MVDKDYSKRIKEEEKRMFYLIKNSDEELSFEEFLDKYASEEYKDYIKRKKAEKEELRKHGIFID